MIAGNENSTPDLSIQLLRLKKIPLPDFSLIYLKKPIFTQKNSQNNVFFELSLKYLHEK